MVDSSVVAISGKFRQPSRKEGLVIPFVNTSPAIDVRWLFLLLPVWWLMGVEQFVWTILLLWSCLKVLVKKQFRVRVVPTVFWLLLFLCVHTVSGFFIVERFRLITFFRNFNTYVTAFLLVFVITNSVNSWYQVQALL